ncbi:hypothetical protein ELE36_02625 [Pseudolysobacter antarcticus]|uniref:Uncharacterized protein n=1 Tax=Pseudolysobacter antarcticus TaxID=2511995 RepID=A0A411HFY1_9GAMM|nr:hypothetical protein [Pseudolysobacter antarcticus]QBB69357.1 hypothetical protein ELE36_02625 [Pseudolysobacter antarcticus]
MNTITPRHPTSLKGIKHAAQQLRRRQPMKHATALDMVARQAGFQSYRHALNASSSNVVPASPLHPAQPQHMTYVTAYWFDKRTGARGRETLKVSLSKPLAAIVTRYQTTYCRGLMGFLRPKPNHLRLSLRELPQKAAQEAICVAARTLAFMDATGMVPSNRVKMAYPGGNRRDLIPYMDHESIWIDPVTLRYLVVDEPYEGRLMREDTSRMDWAQASGYDVRTPQWAGIHNPGETHEIRTIL